jgi:AraC-like DNA-binding protein
LLQLFLVCVDDMRSNWQIEEARTPYNIFILVTKEKLTYTIEGVDVQLEKGDILYIPRNKLRGGRNHPDGPHQKYSAHFHILQPDAFPFLQVEHFCKIRTRQLDYMTQRFVVLLQQWLGHLPQYQIISQGILSELLGHMGREAEMTVYSPAKIKLVKTIQTYLIQHYRETVSIPRIAELSGRSPNYISQTYKEITGLSPIAYIHHLRIQTAMDLLINNHMTIGEISDYLGYSDQSHFNRMFKKLMGGPPSSVKR